MKKETLEEASKKYALYKKDLKHLSNREYDLCKNDFIEGAKWQSERMYSNDILDILDNILYWDTCPEEYKSVIKSFVDNVKNTNK